MGITRAACVAALTAGLVSLTFGLSSASAAPPGNDTIGGATPVGLGFGEQLDTTQATTDAEDAAVNAGCGAPATDASVWYAYTAAQDGGVVVGVSESNYSAGVIVATGMPGALSVVTCGPGAVAFLASAGTRYYVLAFDDQFDGAGNGGTLDISVDAAPPPPTLDVTLDPTGRVDGKTGIAYVGGTVTCTNADFAAIFTSLSQRIGVRAIVSGFGSMFADATACDGTAQRWSSQIRPEGGKFAGGKSAAFAFGFACGAFECRESYSEQTVKLRGGK